MSDEERDQVLTVGADNVVKVWDVRNQRCLQTMLDLKAETRAGFGRVHSAACVPRTGHIVLASSGRLHPWKLTAAVVNTTVTSHQAAVVSVLYHPGFRQIVSGDANGQVQIWNIDSGALQSAFNISPADSGGAQTNGGSAGTITGGNKTDEQQTDSTGVSPDGILTALCFDGTGRRVITGTHFGRRLRLWNFSNGCELASLVKQGDSDDESGDEHKLPSDDPRELEKRYRQRLRSIQKRERDANSTKVRPTFKASSSKTSTRRNTQTTGATLEGDDEDAQVEGSDAGGDEDLGDDDSDFSNADVDQTGHDDDADGSHECFEVVDVVYGTAAIPQGVGKPNTFNRYIIAAGWDRRVYIWTDDGELGDEVSFTHVIELDYNTVLANTGRMAGHTKDLTACVFCAPSTVATCAGDGKVITWDIHTRYGNTHL